MLSIFLFFLFHGFSLTHCNRFLNFSGTSFYLLYYLYENDVLCINTTKTDWSFIGNGGMQNLKIRVHYKDETGMKQIINNESDFLGFHIFGYESSIEIISKTRVFSSLAMVSFDYDCDIRIISNLVHDTISSSDWPTPELTNKKLCYFNGLSFKNHFSRSFVSKNLTAFRNSDGSYIHWSSKEVDTSLNHPPILEHFYDKNSLVSVSVEDSSIMSHGRSVLILNSTNKKTAIFKGLPYDSSACLFYDFKAEIDKIKEANYGLISVCFFFFASPAVYIITYCYCCPCCRYYRPQCLYRFGLQKSDQDNDPNNPNSHNNSEQNCSPNNNQQPVYYVFQQHISQTPQIAPQGLVSDGQFHQPVMSLTVNPPPGVYEPVRVASPIVPVTIVDDE